MKNILLPTDFSENAWNAIKYAISMYADEGCNFILLHSYYSTPPAHDVIVPNYWAAFEKDSRFGLNKTLERISSKLDLRDSKCEIISRFGKVAGLVPKIVDEKKIDLIIMGTKGASGIGEVLMGSNTARVINNTVIPVIAVPEDCVYKSPKSILLATDYKKLEDHSVLDTLKEIMVKHNSDLMILNILHEAKDMVGIEESLEGFALHGYWGDLKHSYDLSNNEKPEDGINKYAEENDVDMISLVKRDHPFFEWLFSKSVSKKMVFHTEVPLLVLHE